MFDNVKKYKFFDSIINYYKHLSDRDLYKELNVGRIEKLTEEEFEKYYEK